MNDGLENRFAYFYKILAYRISMKNENHNRRDLSPMNQRFVCVYNFQNEVDHFYRIQPIRQLNVQTFRDRKEISVGKTF